MDIVFLRDLRIDTVIGIYGWERRTRQTLIFDLEMSADIASAAASRRHQGHPELQIGGETPDPVRRRERVSTGRDAGRALVHRSSARSMACAGCGSP